MKIFTQTNSGVSINNLKTIPNVTWGIVFLCCDFLTFVNPVCKWGSSLNKGFTKWGILPFLSVFFSHEHEMMKEFRHIMLMVIKGSGEAEILEININ